MTRAVAGADDEAHLAAMLKRRDPPQPSPPSLDGTGGDAPAHPTSRPDGFSVEAAARETLRRFPKVMARLAQ